MSKRIIPEPYLSHSKTLRKEHNPWEIKLWRYLRANRFYDLKFKRQVQIGNYIYDFSCRSKMLIIELDGGQHARTDISLKDKEKKNFAERVGYKVLRFWNNDLDSNLQGVLEKIKIACGV